jgi:hypothetical protein
VEFVVQGQSRDFESDGIFHELGDRSGSVTVTKRTDPLDPVAFREMLLATDVILLPYDIGVYGLQGSGLVQDAIAARIPLIHTQGMSMRSLLGHGNAIAAKTDAEFAAAILKMARCEIDLTMGCKVANETYCTLLRNHPLKELLTNLDHSG